MSDLRTAAQALLDRIDAHDVNAAPRRRLGGWPTVEALREALAARAQPTNDDVLWEGPLSKLGADWLAGLIPVPPGASRDQPVRVVRATDQPSEDQP